MACQKSLSVLRRPEDGFVHEMSHQLQKVVGELGVYSQSMVHELLALGSPKVLIIHSDQPHFIESREIVPNNCSE